MKNIRWFPAIVGGFLSGLAIYFLVSLLAGGPQIWSLFVGWILIGYWAGKGERRAWGRVWLVLCIVCFAMPLASLAFGAHVTSDVMNSSQSSAEQAGAAIGGVIGTSIITGFTAFVGFFSGIIFAILAYFGLRSPRTLK